MPPKRPRRQRKGDRLLYSGAARVDIECDYAVGPLDRVAREMDDKWGIDQLPELVDPEMARKYGAAISALNDALANQDPAAASANANNCIRGLRAMDAEAERLGHKPGTGEHYEYELPDCKIAIMRDGKEWPALKARRPDLIIFTLREAALALEARMKTAPIAEVKDLFPGAEVTAITQRSKSHLEKELDDEIPEFF